ncbi:hypothetical protein F5148DRAFT_346736 [Russula earlei]|uniref:Uncharacterized protein n=1 Tax=Russula earlei TaxID=71964 RepID=A0ACC0U1C9_9AGAM|nr:hypothetical protein F5148DRAFT_346736 [Russula earlei]
MRRFVADIGGVNTLSLLPMSKEMRKSVHELAQVFGLRSKSRGKDATRFTILTRTALSGVMVDEKRIGRILGKYKTQGGGKERSKAIRTRPRDGEVVGETAPKLDESNIGFQLLSAMGWEQGSRIGVVGGLEAPLVAVIKTTKLGLGATRG